MSASRPAVLSKWLGLAYAGALLLVLLWGADAPDAVLLSFLFLPWIVGPAGLAAVGAKLSTSDSTAWAFFLLEALIVGSTLWVWTYFIVIAPDAQNGIAMVLFPLRQYAAVAAFFVVAVALGWRPSRNLTKNKWMMLGAGAAVVAAVFVLLIP